MRAGSLNDSPRFPVDLVGVGKGVVVVVLVRVRLVVLVLVPACANAVVDWVDTGLVVGDVAVVLVRLDCGAERTKLRLARKRKKMCTCISTNEGLRMNE